MRFFFTIIYWSFFISLTFSQSSEGKRLFIGADATYHAVNSNPNVFDRSDYGEVPLHSFGGGLAFGIKLSKNSFLLSGVRYQRSYLEMNMRGSDVYSEIGATTDPNGSLTNTYALEVPSLFGGILVNSEISFFQPEGVEPFMEGDDLNIALILGSRLNSLSMPILYHYEMGENERRLSIFIEGGLDLHYALSSVLDLTRVRVYGFYVEQYRRQNVPPNEWVAVTEVNSVDIQSLFEERHRRFNVLGAANLGVTLNPNKNISVHSGLGFSASLLSANKNSSLRKYYVRLLARVVYNI